MARRAATTRVPGYDERARDAAAAADERPGQGHGNPRPPPPDHGATAAAGRRENTLPSLRPGLPRGAAAQTPPRRVAAGTPAGAEPGWRMEFDHSAWFQTTGMAPTGSKVIVGSPLWTRQRIRCPVRMAQRARPTTMSSTSWAVPGSRTVPGRTRRGNWPHRQVGRAVFSFTGLSPVSRARAGRRRLPGVRPWPARARNGSGAPRCSRSEVTDRMLIVGERHLRRTLDEYARHYNGRRPHRALDLQPPRSDRPPVDLRHQRIKRRPVLGGLITEYERAAQKSNPPCC
jgi:hypothetical protein